MLFFYGVLLGFVLLVYPLLVLLHELGHAVPALLFTRARVAVYLGTYGDHDNSWRLRVGLLEIYLKKWTFFWSKGLCVPSSSDMTTTQQVLMTLGGVTVSLAIAVLGFYGALLFDWHGAVKLFLFLLTIFAVVTLITNLIPREYAGLASDGLLLKQLLTGKRLAATFTPELQALIARSREVAIDLGYDYISTLHLFLADCAMPYPYSLTSVFFADAAAYQEFYEQHRVGPVNAGAGSLPITTEFEQALKQAAAARRHGFGPRLYPCHLFLAATEVPDSVFAQVAAEPAALPQTLLAHYRQFGELWSTA